MSRPNGTVYYVAELDELVRGEEALRALLTKHTTRNRAWTVQEYRYAGLVEFEAKKVETFEITVRKEDA